MPTRKLFPTPRHCQPLSGIVDTSAWQEASDLAPISQLDPSYHPEGFSLHLSTEQLTITLGSPAAQPYVWQCLQQWRGDDPAHTACVHIDDAPELDVRGFMLDVSRDKVPARASLTRWVEWLAAFRFNQLQLYTEHTFAYPGHESVWKKASPLTPEDILWLRDLCRKHQIELVPNQNCFGHFERWIAHPDYRQFAESPDGYVTPWGDHRDVGSVLKPDQASFDLVSGLLDYLLPLFDSPHVNIGCDETFELGQGASRELCEKQGTGTVYTDFLIRMMDHVRNHHGRQPQYWADILLSHPEQLSRLPSEATALLWGYEASHPFAKQCKTLSDLGQRFIVCPGTSSWQSFAGRSENMIDNVSKAVHHAVNFGSKGILLTDWGDCGHLQMEEVSAPALAWCGLNAWNPESASMDDAATWCDREVFANHQGDTQAWLAAGRVSDRLNWHPGNSSALFQLFLHSSSKQDHLDAIPDSALTDALQAVDELPTPVSNKHAWEQTLRNLRLPLLREQYRRGGAPVPAEVEKAARDGHQTLWLTRNRSGGLAESLSMYTKTQTP